MNGMVGGLLREVSVHYSICSLEGLRQTMKDLNKDSQSLAQNANLESPRHEAG
jgi:hypothetical protein